MSSFQEDSIYAIYSTKYAQFQQQQQQQQQQQPPYSMAPPQLRSNCNTPTTSTNNMDSMYRYSTNNTVSPQQPSTSSSNMLPPLSTLPGLLPTTQPQSSSNSNSGSLYNPYAAFASPFSNYPSQPTNMFGSYLQPQTTTMSNVTFSSDQSSTSSSPCMSPENSSSRTSSTSSTESTDSTGKKTKAKRTKKACDLCNQKRTKCSGEHPRCLQCIRTNSQCTYLREEKKRGRASPNYPPKIQRRKPTKKQLREQLQKEQETRERMMYDQQKQQQQQQQQQYQLEPNMYHYDNTNGGYTEAMSNSNSDGGSNVGFLNLPGVSV